MNLIDVVMRASPPETYSEGEKIPWDDPEFSARMLKYHLSQDHDAASRRFRLIDKHVRFIDGLTGGPTSMLDLACGPGFYTSRFTGLGYRCKGIDFGPASVEYAIRQAKEAGQVIDYVLGDIRTTEYGEGYGLVTLIYGEFNVFRREEILGILRKAYASLVEGGLFIVEPHSFEAIKSFGEAPSTWYTADGALFSDKPHFVLTEHFWNPDRGITVNRHIVIDAASGDASIHADAMVAYTNEEYIALFKDVGFRSVDFHRTLTGEEVDEDEHLMVIVARK
jgi:SAM-dependent methyltransferase